MEAEADKETEELAVAAKAKRRCNDRETSRRQQKQQRKPQPVDANAGILGAAAQQPTRALLDQTEQQAAQNDTDYAVATEPKASCSAGFSVEPAAVADTAEDAAFADTAGDGETAVAAEATAAAAAAELPAENAVDAAAAELDPAEAAALPVDVSKLLLSGRTVGAPRWQAVPASVRPRFTIPAAFRGPDCGPGAAAGGALGGFDSCWSAPKEPSSKQQRSAKRKRDSSGCVGPRSKQDADCEDQGSVDISAAATAAEASMSGKVRQPPPGKPLAVGTRPAWLQQVEAGTAHLNKRRQGSWEDDLNQPQEVEFMLGCSKCSCQRVSWLWCVSEASCITFALALCWVMCCLGQPVWQPLSFRLAWTYDCKSGNLEVMIVHICLILR